MLRWLPPALKGLDAGELHVAVLRAWARLAPRLVAAPVRLRRGVTTTAVLRELARLPGFGPYSGACFCKTLLAGRLARWDGGGGPVGPGAEAALRWLRGEASARL